MTSDVRKTLYDGLGRINLKEIIENIDESLLKHPKFEDLLRKEINYLFIKTSNSDVQVNVSLDKKSVVITTNKPVVDCSIPEFRGNNRTFIQSKIFLSGENLFIDYSQGVLFNRKQLEENGLRTTAIYESKFETFYQLKCFNKYGIEYSNSTYSDSYPLKQKEFDVDVREQTLSSFHKPIFNEYKLPKASIHILEAKVRNTYKKEQEYALIHTNVAKITKEGYNDVNCALFTTHFLFPEMLRGDRIIAKSVLHEGRYIFLVEKDYAESIEEAIKKAKEEFKAHLIEKEKELDKDVYEFLMNNN